MLWKRFVFFALGAILLVSASLLFLNSFFKPNPQNQSEIYRGVFLSVEDLSNSAEGKGKLMIVEVHWDTPGVKFENRPFDYSPSANDTIGFHHKLKFADFALKQTGAAILMNTTLFYPDSRLRSFPGTPIRSLETLVVDGVASHVHEHSYLLYWDAAKDVHMSLAKPPSPEILSNAILGIGLQGVQVQSAQGRYNSLGSLDEVYARTFIGVDPDKRILYLMAFENASGRFMIDRAIQAGVVYGGQLDSGSSTNLLIGENARGVKAHTGIRNLRPIGPYLTVYADPL